jgi:beta-lactamase regulating signal transducer with metallopeptidase domain
MTLLLTDILNTLLPASGLVAGVWIAMWLLRLNAATRYAAWWVVLAVVLAMPFLPRPVDRAQPEQAIVSFAAAEPVIAVDSEPGPVAPRPHVKELDWTSAAVSIYAAVAGFLLLRLFVDFLRVRKLLAEGQPMDEPCEEARGIRLLSSRRIETPLAAGFFRPAILLPSGLANKLTGDELRHVVMHEAAHIARLDHWANLLGKIVQAVCWPHPLLMIIINRIDEDREHACDDWVVAATGQPASYARSLAKLVELTLAGRQRQPMLASTVIGKGPRVSKRVAMLLDKTRNFAPRVSVPKLTMSLICLAVFVAICAEAPMLVAVASPRLEDAYVEDPQAPLAPPPPPAGRAPLAPRAAPTPPGPHALPPQAAVPALPPPPPDPAARPGFLAALGAAGYRDLSVDEIIELKNHGVDANYIRDMSGNGWGKLSAQDLMKLRDHGVSAQYLRDIRDSGIKGLTLDSAIELRNHGVNTRTIAEIHSLGFGPYTDREVVELASHGVRPDLFRSLKENGIPQISAKDAMEAAASGLTGRSLVEARKYGPNLSFEQILKLKRAGVI